MPAAPASPAAPGFFTGGNPGAGQQATVPGYEWFNGVQEELIGMLTRAGVTPALGDVTQLRQSLDRLYGGGLATYSANATLTPADAGLVLVNASSGARTITLPAANALGGRPIRYQIEKTDNSANAVTVQRAGSDTIEGATSVVLSGQWASVTLVSDGVGSWVALRGRLATAAETDAGTLSDVAVTPAGLGISTRLFSANGYQRLPGGLIIQWGETATADIAGVVTRSATFPIAFPNACRAVFGVVFSAAAAGSAVDGYVTDIRGTLTGMTAYLEERTGSIVQNCGCRYFAIGN
jgi:hypothetical protein